MICSDLSSSNPVAHKGTHKLTMARCHRMNKLSRYLGNPAVQLAEGSMVQIAFSTETCSRAGQPPILYLSRTQFGPCCLQEFVCPPRVGVCSGLCGHWQRRFTLVSPAGGADSKRQ